MAFEIGVMTFGEVTEDPVSGALRTPHQRARETIELAKVADEVGLDVFGIGEHHRTDFVGSAPSIMLAAAAEATQRIRLASAVTVLGSEAPCGCGSSSPPSICSPPAVRRSSWAGTPTPSRFPLFGYDLADYSDLFREKLDLLLRIREQNPITWTGRLRAPLVDAGIAPRAYGDTIPVWVGVGGSPASAMSTGTLGLPLALAILFGPMSMLQDQVQLYRAAAEQAGHDPATLPVSMSVGGYVDSSPQQARDVMYPHFAKFMMVMEHNHQRGRGMLLPRDAFEAGASHAGSYLVGDPEEVADKVLRFREMYGLTRIIIHMGMGACHRANSLPALSVWAPRSHPSSTREIGDA